METILITLSPFAVALVTQLVKMLGDKFTNFRDAGGLHTALFRFLAVALSFGSVVIAALLAGVEIDATAISTFSEALLVFLGSTGIYFITKKKKS